MVEPSLLLPHQFPSRNDEAIAEGKATSTSHHQHQCHCHQHHHQSQAYRQVSHHHQHHHRSNNSILSTFLILPQQKGNDKSWAKVKGKVNKGPLLLSALENGQENKEEEEEEVSPLRPGDDDGKGFSGIVTTTSSSNCDPIGETRSWLQNNSSSCWTSDLTRKSWGKVQETRSVCLESEKERRRGGSEQDVLKVEALSEEISLVQKKVNNNSNIKYNWREEGKMRSSSKGKGSYPAGGSSSWGSGLGKWNFWMIASLLLLNFLGSTHSFSILDDDDDDDEFGGSSAFGHSVYQRSRRSAESFSTLHDALSLIPSNYSIHEPPPTNNSEATQVDFSVLIMNVRDIKELNEGYGDLELSLEMNLRIYWKDTRLSHLADRSGNKFIVLNPVLLEKIWHPDIFIDHVKGVAQPALISKPASLRVYPDSSVRYSARITVTMACQMDFHYYPADTQRCNVDMKSYAYSSKILALDWREGKGALLVEYLELPNFDVALDTTQNFMVNTSSGSYAGIRFTILLRRKLSYHLIQTYLPSTLFIIVSWLSFLVPPESVPGRMALCMTTLLTLTAMFSAVRQNTPNVSYVKALDIWMVVCIIFVFLTLVEYTVLLKLKSKKPKPKPQLESKPAPQTELVTSPPPPPQSHQPQPVNRWTIPTFQYAADTQNFKFRGCKSAEGVLTESTSSSNGEMRHRENGETVGPGGDNNHPVTPQLPLAPPPPPPPTAAPLAPGEKQLNKYELAAKKIEKFTSAVIPTLFVIFNFIYWPWLIESADYYHHEKSTTIFKSM